MLQRGPVQGASRGSMKFTDAKKSEFQLPASTLMLRRPGMKLPAARPWTYKTKKGQSSSLG